MSGVRDPVILYAAYESACPAGGGEDTGDAGCADRLNRRDLAFALELSEVARRRDLARGVPQESACGARSRSHVRLSTHRGIPRRRLGAGELLRLPGRDLRLQHLAVALECLDLRPEISDIRLQLLAPRCVKPCAATDDE